MIFGRYVCCVFVGYCFLFDGCLLVCKCCSCSFLCLLYCCNFACVCADLNVVFGSLWLIVRL